MACERSKLHFMRRILGSRECESAGIDRDENGVNALLGVSYSIDSGGTVSQRSCAHKLSLHDSQLFDLVTLPADIPPNRGAPKHYTGAMHAVEFDRSIPNRRNRPPQPRCNGPAQPAELQAHARIIGFLDDATLPRAKCFNGNSGDEEKPRTILKCAVNGGWGVALGLGGSLTAPPSLMQNTRSLGGAPVGHRQPHTSDVPSQNASDLEHISEEDAAVDRKLTICRGC